jgi:hypothetical protein
VNQKYVRVTPRPQMMDKFFTWFSKIDVHDHRRQGILRMEQYWKTKDWSHRIFATILGICVVDAYLAYKLEFEANDCMTQLKSFNDWASELAYGLIFNNLNSDQPRQKRQRKGSDTEDSDDLLEQHVLLPLCKHPLHLHKESPRLRCRVCKVNTAMYCSFCSKQNADGSHYIYACCNSFKGSRGQPKTCYFDHLNQE